MPPHGHTEYLTFSQDDPVPLDAIDPVCKMKVDPENPKGGSFTHQGTAYHFCNPKCNAKFQAEP